MRHYTLEVRSDCDKPCSTPEYSETDEDDSGSTTESLCGSPIAGQPPVVVPPAKMLSSSSKSLPRVESSFPLPRLSESQIAEITERLRNADSTEKRAAVFTDLKKTPHLFAAVVILKEGFIAECFQHYINDQQQHQSWVSPQYSQQQQKQIGGNNKNDNDRDNNDKTTVEQQNQNTICNNIQSTAQHEQPQPNVTASGIRQQLHQQQHLQQQAQARAAVTQAHANIADIVQRSMPTFQRINNITERLTNVYADFAEKFAEIFADAEKQEFAHPDGELEVLNAVLKLNYGLYIPLYHQYVRGKLSTEEPVSETRLDICKELMENAATPEKRRIAFIDLSKEPRNFAATLKTHEGNIRYQQYLLEKHHIAMSTLNKKLNQNSPLRHTPTTYDPTNNQMISLLVNSSLTSLPVTVTDPFLQAMSLYGKKLGQAIWSAEDEHGSKPAELQQSVPVSQKQPQPTAIVSAQNQPAGLKPSIQAGLPQPLQPSIMTSGKEHQQQMKTVAQSTQQQQQQHQLLQAALLQQQQLQQQMMSYNYYQQQQQQQLWRKQIQQQQISYPNTMVQKQQMYPLAANPLQHPYSSALANPQLMYQTQQALPLKDASDAAAASAWASVGQQPPQLLNPFL